MIHPMLLRKQKWLLLISILSIIVIAFVSLGLGYSSVGFSRIPAILSGDGTFKENFVLFSLRLPRIAITILAGMALALSGAILQGVTKNDLADPGIVGINAGAGVGVAIYFLFAPIDANSFVYLLPIVAFVSACITAFLIYMFSYEKKVGLHPVKFVLVGVGFSMALSGLMVVLISSAEREKVDFIAQWLAGNIWGDDWPFVITLLPWLLLLVPITFFKSNNLNILNLDEKVAVGVGMNKEKERWKLIIIAVALAAAAVSVTGGISFVGLMAPHIAKSLVGPRHQLFMPVALVLGGLLLLIADTVGRNVLEPDGLAAGIVTALIGAPYFIYLMLKKM
ncbi:iron ABC transporter permease [Gracilibacillus caseinilyticus]|uniref:Iron ABC transporter permease n=1 Tax=Gracilibacillus caseinilyticus TaxID=2932256 RepID=A0ABY4EXW7_9BACI|nr:iron ABC transporter permease [Gracilibacillus caseinilyticus]UOQ49251.1 iron ABC transporter permease [Gracilibacillus caseinilyticus]